jgi:hypothetical protein
VGQHVDEIFFRRPIELVVVRIARLCRSDLRDLKYGPYGTIVLPKVWPADGDELLRDGRHYGLCSRR